MYLIVLSGPTASGKTRLAIELAQHYKTVVVSADSRQFFREMNIGTAKPDAEELAAAPHYFIDSHSIETAYSVGQYETEALELLQQLFTKHEVVILTGGSGLYLKAVCEGLDPFPEIPEAVKAGVEADFQKHGLPYLQEALRASDPTYYQTVDLENPHRLIRALAVYRSSGKPFSSFRQNAAAGRPFNPIYLQLQWPRATLYERINHRVDLMMEAGLQQEAQALFAQRHLPALQTVGYQELFDHFEGKIALEEAVELIKRNSRRYAKRQLTWFRRDGFWKLFQPHEFEQARAYIDLCMEENLAWAQQRHSDRTQGQLLQSDTPIAQFERTTRNGQSLSVVELPPPQPLAWLLWHQLRLMAMEDEAAYLTTPGGLSPPDWPKVPPSAFPGWAHRQVTEKVVSPVARYRIPKV
ncbi:MAG: tRNA (adenosine(37)-N6)-dimethylallyltransferase MiaA [Phaeodactylibacter sp.]|uniref:tRNA (adenosine(37)-N6)-dimethylallyltransferase MiaA n=1 Tax=Phaeodactylibacter sp. TaxID=1940289 RepID=UPI0032EE8CB5